MTKIITVLGVALLGVLLVFVIIEGRNRAKWREEHCTIIGEVSSSTGIGSSIVNGKAGVTTVYIPGKTGYKCDDGLEYWE